jgi:GNAT superfamily N-acetyltransferase
MNPSKKIRSGYRVTTNQKRFNIPAIHKFLRSTYWAKDIPVEVVVRSIRNSLSFGVFYQDAQIGFARVITDRATFAYIADVFVTEKHRGRGVGRILINRILADKRLQGLRRILLATQDAHAFYQPFGFRPLAHPERYLTIGFSNLYSRKAGVGNNSKKTVKQ